MAPPAAWPPLPQTPLTSVEAVRELIRAIAAPARRFERALEQAAEAGEADLSRLAEPLAEWERCAAGVFAYTGLGEGRPLPAQDPAALGAQLRALHLALAAQRDALLARLGTAAKRIVAREGALELDAGALSVGEGPAGVPAAAEPREHEAAYFRELPAAELREPSAVPMPEFIEGELPGDAASGLDGLSGPADGGHRALTGEVESGPLQQRAASPVRADEVRARQLAESKPYPKSGGLAALLENQPAEWIRVVGATLGLKAGSAGGSAAERLGALRQAIAGHLLRPGALDVLLATFGEQERALLTSLTRSGMLPYSQVLHRFGADADGYSWSERPASGPLSVLRRAGLAFVCTEGGQLLVALPADLVESARNALRTA